MAADATQTKLQAVLPGEITETYPDVFNIKGMPEQPLEKKPGQLPDRMIKQFFEKGYVIVESFFKKEELDACRESIEVLVDDLANLLYNGKKIKNLYKDYGLFERLTHIEKEFPGANIILHKQGKLTQAFRDLWSSPRLLNVVEQLIGPDIMGHPVWNLRTKTPCNEATTVPWHQDCAYLDTRSYDVLQPTAWIPLLDANKENGCMEVAVGGHLKGKVAKHQCCWGATWYVQLLEEEMVKTLGIDMDKDVQLCCVPYGGMLLINNLIPHRSLPNLSDQIRWSLDLRWQRPNLPVGFYDLKEGVLMRTKENPDMKIDWDCFDSVDRHNMALKAVAKDCAEEENPEFDTTIQGPWMRKWELVHMNRHTDALEEDKLTWHKS
ncbi:phytanoyl-CoA dioxygenase domain-containing protein 1-like [Babylonia areolata]|uniref:phytanoyl-CoA dioxygenase domain-containing protein 1-like n=1 Tax=Babylonia areolata TaxID=304850 RepID=UPI003FD5F0FF